MVDSTATVPVTIIGGFLGAGKTTLLNRLLAVQNAPRCAVLVNDFGDIAVDAALIASRDSNTIALKNGCVCCSIGNDLGKAISEALSLTPGPERIIIEASGVSHPERIMDVARISNELTACGIFVLADAFAIKQQLADRWIADTVLQQLESADRIVISKMNTLPATEQITTVEQLVRQFPLVALSTVSDISWADITRLQTKKIKTSTRKPHVHFASRTLRSTYSPDLKKLQCWLNTHPGVYRIKGWYKEKSDDGVKLLQVVDQRINISDSDQSIDDRLVAIVIGDDNLPESNEILQAII